MDDKERKKEEIEETEPQEQVKKTVINLPLIIGGGLLILIILVGGGIFAMKAISTPAEATESDTSDAMVEDEEGGYASTGVYYSEFDAFITVLSSDDEFNFTYLKFVPQFELSDQKVSAEIAMKLPSIEDKINSVMTDLDWGAIKSERGRERVGEKLTEKLNELLESGKIVKTYFTTFVAQ